MLEVVRGVYGIRHTRCSVNVSRCEGSWALAYGQLGVM